MIMKVIDLKILWVDLTYLIIRPTIFVDDVKITELTGSNSDHAFSISLSKAQTSDVSFDYVISSASTASSSDYENLSNGTVTIAAGTTSALINFSVIGDDVAEGQDDEKIVLTLSNPINAVLGRSRRNCIYL